MPEEVLVKSESHQVMLNIEIFLNILNQACIGFVTIYMSWLCISSGLAGTSLHAWLVTIGFTLLMAEAMMCFYKANALTLNYKRFTKTTVHWVLQVIGSVLGIAGILIKVVDDGFPLQTTHAKLGFSTLILCLISLLSGLSAIFSKGLRKILRPLFNKGFHNFLGIATYTVALVTQFYGYKTGFFSRKVDTSFQILTETVTLVSLVLTCIGPLKSFYHKFRSI